MLYVSHVYQYYCGLWIETDFVYYKYKAIDRSDERCIIRVCMCAVQN